MIEDAAHAMGAEYHGIKIGALDRGNIVTFSLQAIKHITTSDGGLLCLPSEELYERAKLLRWYGIDRKKRNNHKNKDFRLESGVKEYGFKFHMSDWSEPGIGKFSFLGKNLARHRSKCTLLR